MKRKAAAILAMLALGLTVTACQGQRTPDPAPASAPGGTKNLIVYFSLGENAPYPADMDASASASVMIDGGKRIGTTAYVARLIQEDVGGDVHSIHVADPYSTHSRDVIDRNHQEIAAGTLPALTDAPVDMSAYDTVYIGYPVWATHAPQAIFTFLSAHDLSGKTLIPFCTHDGYGPGDSYEAIARAVQGEKETKDGLDLDAADVPQAAGTVEAWLRELGELPDAPEEGTPVRIAVNGETVNAVWYDTALAEEIRSRFPLDVSMTGWGGREYYGPLPFTPAHAEGGQLRFADGDITYCPQNNTLAVFYDQTDRPNLTMEVIPVGRVTSDLSLFHRLPQQAELTFSL